MGGGFAIPTVHNHLAIDVRLPDASQAPTKDGSQTLGPAFWGEAVFNINQRLTFQAGLERSALFDLKRAHQMHSLLYSADIRHRETVFSAILGVQGSNRRVTIRGIVGGAIVHSHTVETGTFLFGIFSGSPAERRVTKTNTRLIPAIVGGLEVPVAVSRRARIVPRLRFRAAFREGVPYITSEVTDVFAKFSVSPGVGVEVGF